MARKDSNNYHFTRQEQIIIKKSEDARLPEKINTEERQFAAAKGSKIE